MLGKTALNKTCSSKVLRKMGDMQSYMATPDRKRESSLRNLAILRRSLPGRSNGRLRSNGWNREQNKKHFRALQLTRTRRNTRAPPPTLFSERMGRGGLAKGQKKRKTHGRKGGKAIFVSAAITRLSLPGDRTRVALTTEGPGGWACDPYTGFQLIWADRGRTASQRRKSFS